MLYISTNTHYIKPSLGNWVARLGVSCSASQENRAEQSPQELLVCTFM